MARPLKVSGWNWWRFSSFGFALGAVGVSIPLAWTGWLLLRQIEAAQRSDVLAVMIGKGLGGTPGITDSSVSILALAATVAIFSGLSVALAEYGRRRLVAVSLGKRIQPRLDHRIVDEIARRWDVATPIALLLSWAPFSALTQSILTGLVLAFGLSIAFQSGDSGITATGRFAWIAATVATGTLKSAMDGIIDAAFAYLAWLVAAIAFFTWLHFKIRPPSTEAHP